MQRRTRTPTTHALGHPNDPIKVRVAPLHPASLLSYTSRCPPPAARTCGTHSWVFGIRLSLECLPEPLPSLPTTRVPPPVDLHSLPFRYSRLRAAHTHPLPDPSVTEDVPLLWTTSPSFAGRQLHLLFWPRPGPTPGSDTPPSPHLGSQIRWSCASPDKGRLKQLGNLAVVQASRPWRTLLPCTTIRGDHHSFFLSSTSTTSCPIHQTAAPATALFFMR